MHDLVLGAGHCDMASFWSQSAATGAGRGLGGIEPQEGASGSVPKAMAGRWLLAIRDP